MFSFDQKEYTVIEHNKYFGELKSKYANNYLIIMNGHVENEQLHGDVVAVLTEDEYHQIELPKDVAPRFSILKGSEIRKKETEGYLGFSV